MHQHSVLDKECSTSKDDSKSRTACKSVQTQNIGPGLALAIECCCAFPVSGWRSVA